MLIGDAPQTDRERALGQRVDLYRVNLERLQDELDRAIDLRVGLRKQLAREVAAKVEADLATQAVRAHAEDVAARLVQVIWEDAHWIARLTDQRDTARHFNRKNATRADATAIDLRECEEAYAGAEWVAARLVEVICNEAERTARWQREWRAALAATPVTAGRIADERDEAWSAYMRAADDRDKAEAALAEANARGDEWSRVAHRWAMQRDDARRRAEEAERVIEAMRGTARQEFFDHRSARIITSLPGLQVKYVPDATPDVTGTIEVDL